MPNFEACLLPITIRHVFGQSLNCLWHHDRTPMCCYCNSNPWIRYLSQHGHQIRVSPHGYSKLFHNMDILCPLLSRYGVCQCFLHHRVYFVNLHKERRNKNNCLYIKSNFLFHQITLYKENPPFFPLLLWWYHFQVIPSHPFFPPIVLCIFEFHTHICRCRYRDIFECEIKPTRTIIIIQ